MNRNRNGDKGMGRVAVEFTLANNEDLVMASRGALPPENVRRGQFHGVVDTGAARLVLPETVVQQLGLPDAGEATVRYADNRRRVKEVWLMLQGREGVFSATVEPDRKDALVGAIVMEELDLVVDCITQKVHPRDPNRIISEIE